MKGHQLKIADKLYNVSCTWGIPHKIRNIEDLGVVLKITVYSVEEERYLKWEEMKDTYLAEKISDFAENSFNGQNTFYWREDDKEV